MKINLNKRLIPNLYTIIRNRDNKEYIRLYRSDINDEYYLSNSNQNRYVDGEIYNCSDEELNILINTEPYTVWRRLINSGDLKVVTKGYADKIVK